MVRFREGNSVIVKAPCTQTTSCMGNKTMSKSRAFPSYFPEKKVDRSPRKSPVIIPAPKPSCEVHSKPDAKSHAPTNAVLFRVVILYDPYPTCQFDKSAEVSVIRRGMFRSRLPSTSSLLRGARIRSNEMFQSYLCCIFFCIVDMLSVIPESRCDVLSLDCHRAGPCCPAT